MKKLLFISLAILAGHIMYADEVTIYRSYNEYMRGAGTEYEQLQKMTKDKDYVLVVKNTGNKEEIQCAQIWGFEYKESLFRIDHESGNPLMLVNEGKVCYYENGQAHLEMLLHNSKEEKLLSGYWSYISEKLDTPVTPIPASKVSDARKPYEKFQEQYPQFASLYECIGKVGEIEKVRECIKSFESR